MLEAGANPSATIDGDGSPLIGAARSGRSEITKLLLDQGADPNGVVEGDGSPLIQAAADGRLDQVQMLIDRGADVNLAVEGDENPLMNAAEQRPPARSCSCSSRRAPTSTRGSRPSGTRVAANGGRRSARRARTATWTSCSYLESRGARE